MHIDLEKQLQLESFLCIILTNQNPLNKIFHDYEPESIIAIKFIKIYLNCLSVIDQDNLDNAIRKGLYHAFMNIDDVMISFTTPIYNDIVNRLYNELKYLVKNENYF